MYVFSRPFSHKGDRGEGAGTVYKNRCQERTGACVVEFLEDFAHVKFIPLFKNRVRGEYTVFM